MIVLIDNYDSFSYNLYQLIGSVDPDVKVVRNDAYTVEEIEAMKPEAIILSPGPGKPSDAGICIGAIRYFAGKVPVFGVCLGHQAICEAFGGTVSYAKELMHGKQKEIHQIGENQLFQGLPETFQAARYHSLAALKEELPEELKVTAESEDGEVMAVEHTKYPIYGVQFHPESVMTPPYEESKAVMNEIMDGETSQVQTAAYLTALAMKGETIDEITGSAEGMRSHALQLKHDMDVLEIVGTGGDGSNSFNISTTASLVIAAGGVPVAKHGNRAASSKSGAADVLEALGVKITLTPEQSEKILEKIGICFLFAQTYHTAMKYVAPVRKELGIRTVFNILGPLTNPANANMQIMGVYSEELVEPMAQVLVKLGVKKGMVVYGTDSLDEISMSAPTAVCEICDGKLAPYEIVPEQFGYKKCEKDELKGDTPQENATITRAILDGSEQGAKRQAVCMNAGAALYVAGKAGTLEEGVRLAEQLIDSGAALKKLEAFIRESNEA